MLLTSGATPKDEIWIANEEVFRDAFGFFGCNSCFMCGDWHHEVTADGDDKNISSDPHDCVLGETCEHSVCFASAEPSDRMMGPYQLGELAAVLRSGDIKGIGRLIAAYDNVRWVSTRSALQVDDCTGRVVANIPLAGNVDALGE